jgi:deazaflavin-dependent oxidoreductase (nitroreductase family)
MPHDFNQQVIAEFRANGGQVSGMFEGERLLLLTTTGARSGAPHTVPLGFLPDGADRSLVIGSAGAAARHPAWFHNLVADPRVTVEDGVFVTEALAVVLEGAERDHALARAAEADPGWVEYQAAPPGPFPWWRWSRSPARRASPTARAGHLLVPSSRGCTTPSAGSSR